MAVKILHDLLEFAAETQSQRGLILYSSGNVNVPCGISYDQLRVLAIRNAQLLCRIHGLTKGSVILLHFDNHLDSIIWVWSVLYSGCLPAMSTPFSKDPQQRLKH